MKSIDINDIFAKGGKPLIDFLDYCVRSIQMDPLFIFLVHDYRSRPTVPKAVALYESFCAPAAPGRISAATILPPYDMRLREMVRPLQTRWTEAQPSADANPNVNAAGLLPAKYLFDTIVAELEHGSPSLSRIRRRYKPHRSPLQNLPGGKMNAPQRHFVERVWEQGMRPALTRAGFWRIATIA